MTSDQDDATRPATITHPNDVAEDERLQMERDVEFAATERMMFFSDAVVAIALTLLALELPIPGRDAVSSREVWQQLERGSQEYLAFVISFFVISFQWRTHHAVFRYVNRVSRPILMLNTLWLLLIVVTPTVTKLLSEGKINTLRFSAYAGLETLQYVLFAIMIVVIMRSDFLHPGTDLERFRDWLRRISPVMIGFAASIPVVIILGRLGIDQNWAFTCWVVLPTLLGFGGRLVRLTRARRRERDR